SNGPMGNRPGQGILGGGPSGAGILGSVDRQPPIGSFPGGGSILGGWGGARPGGGIWGGGPPAVASRGGTGKGTQPPFGGMHGNEPPMGGPGIGGGFIGNRQGPNTQKPNFPPQFPYPGNGRGEQNKDDLRDQGGIQLPPIHMPHIPGLRA